jgi:hypothetical protein
MNNETFQFDDQFEERLLAFLIRDIKFFSRNGSFIKREYFSSQISRDIFFVAKSYLEKYDEPLPLDIARNEITKFYRDTKKKDIDIDTYFEFLDKLYKIDISLTFQYAEDVLLKFAQNQEMRRALIAGGERCEKFKDLEPIIEDVTKAYEVGRKIRPIPKSKSLFEILEEPKEEPDYIVDPIFVAGDKSLLIATWKLGKTLLDTQLTLCASKPDSFLGFPVPKSRNIFYLRFELHEKRFKARLHRMIKGMDHNPFEKIPMFNLYRGFDLLNQKCTDWLYSKIDKYETDLLIMEPMYKLFSLPLNKPESTGPILRSYGEIQIRFPKIHIHTAHHERRLPPQSGTKKADVESREKAYGPYQVYADMDWQMFLSSDGKDDPTFTLKFLSNDVDIFPLTLKRDPETLLYVPNVNLDLEKMWKVLNEAGELKQDEFRKACSKKGVGSTRFRNLLSQGIKEGLWAKEEGENCLLYHFLPLKKEPF